MNAVRHLVQSLRSRPPRPDPAAGTPPGGLPFAITAHLAALIDPADAADPIARQFLPDDREAEFAPGELRDPIGDNVHTPVPGIVHRYPDRVLFTPVMTCPVYCRFCFRREAVGTGMLDAGEIAGALDYIRGHTEIWEVILSGGDPLILSPRRLAELVDALDEIGHVAVIRIHTRVPVADPDRVSPELVAALKRATPVYVALHCNHPRELGPAARAAIARLVDAGLPMLSQTVLLKGINDDAATMATLMRTLVACRVKPYYLHHGDLARGTGHFRTTLAAGRALMRALRGRLSGIAQPAYVLDIPGGYGKVPVGPDWVSEKAGGWEVEDWSGRLHRYSDDSAATKK